MPKLEKGSPRLCRLCGQRPVPESYLTRCDYRCRECRNASKRRGLAKAERLPSLERLRALARAGDEEAARQLKLRDKEKNAIARQKYAERVRARQIIRNNIYRGKLSRQPCEVCGNPKSEAHHDDYSRPLDVVWLCPAHHAERHAQLRQAA